MAAKYTLGPDDFIWSHDSTGYSIAVKPLGVAFTQSVLRRVAKEMEADKPEVPIEELDDGSIEEVHTDSYKRELREFRAKVDAEAAERLNKIVIRSCVNEILTGKPGNYEIYDWRAAAEKWRTDNKALIEIGEVPDDDLELFVRFIALKTQDQQESFTSLCFHGQSVEDRAKSFRDT